MAKRYLGGTAMLEFKVEKSPPKAMPAARSAIGIPSMPAICIASAKGASAVAMALIFDAGTIPMRYHWKIAFTANTM